MTTYPSRPTDEDKELIAGLVFPNKPVGDVDFTDVWMLAPYVNDLTFNCFSWSILSTATISIPDRLNNVQHLAGHATEMYGAPFDYELLTIPGPLNPDTGIRGTPVKGAHDATIIAWGDDVNNIKHASRICTKSLLQDYAGEFNLEFDFSSPAAEGFPSGAIWSSKCGDCCGFITHSRNWLDNGTWGTEQGDLRVIDNISCQQVSAI